MTSSVLLDPHVMVWLLVEPERLAADARAALQAAVRLIARKQISDMPDRIIAATSVALGVPLVTADRRIRSSQILTIW